MHLHTIPHHSIARPLYSAVEALRLADRLLGDAHDALESKAYEGGEFISPDHIFAFQMMTRLFVGLFEELIGGVLPDVSDRTLALIGMHQDPCERNIPSAQAAILALSLAGRSLNKALAASSALTGRESWSDLDRAMFGACDTVECHASFLDSATIDLDIETALDAVLRGEQVPAFDVFEKYPEARRDLAELAMV